MMELVSLLNHHHTASASASTPSYLLQSHCNALKELLNTDTVVALYYVLSHVVVVCRRSRHHDEQWYRVVAFDRLPQQWERKKKEVDVFTASVLSDCSGTDPAPAGFLFFDSVLKIVDISVEWAGESGEIIASHITTNKPMRLFITLCNGSLVIWEFRRNVDFRWHCLGTIMACESSSIGNGNTEDDIFITASMLYYGVLIWSERKPHVSKGLRMNNNMEEGSMRIHHIYARKAYWDVKSACMTLGEVYEVLEKGPLVKFIALKDGFALIPSTDDSLLVFWNFDLGTLLLYSWSEDMLHRRLTRNFHMLSIEAQRHNHNRSSSKGLCHMHIWTVHATTNELICLDENACLFVMLPELEHGIVRRKQLCDLKGALNGRYARVLLAMQVYVVVLADNSLVFCDIVDGSVLLDVPAPLELQESKNSDRSTTSLESVKVWTSVAIVPETGLWLSKSSLGGLWQLIARQPKINPATVRFWGQDRKALPLAFAIATELAAETDSMLDERDNEVLTWINELLKTPALSIAVSSRDPERRGFLMEALRTFLNDYNSSEYKAFRLRTPFNETTVPILKTIYALENSDVEDDDKKDAVLPYTITSEMKSILSFLDTAMLISCVPSSLSLSFDDNINALMARIEQLAFNDGPAVLDAILAWTQDPSGSGWEVVTAEWPRHVNSHLAPSGDELYNDITLSSDDVNRRMASLLRADSLQSPNGTVRLPRVGKEFVFEITIQLLWKYRPDKLVEFVVAASNAAVSRLKSTSDVIDNCYVQSASHSDVNTSQLDLYRRAASRLSLMSLSFRSSPSGTCLASFRAHSDLLCSAPLHRVSDGLQLLIYSKQWDDAIALIKRFLNEEILHFNLFRMLFSAFSGDSTFNASNNDDDEYNSKLVENLFHIIPPSCSIEDLKSFIQFASKFEGQSLVILERKLAMALTAEKEALENEKWWQLYDHNDNDD